MLVTWACAHATKLPVMQQVSRWISSFCFWNATATPKHTIHRCWITCQNFKCCMYTLIWCKKKSPQKSYHPYPKSPGWGYVTSYCHHQTPQWDEALTWIKYTVYSFKKNKTDITDDNKPTHCGFTVRMLQKSHLPAFTGLLNAMTALTKRGTSVRVLEPSRWARQVAPLPLKAEITKIILPQS